MSAVRPHAEGVFESPAAEGPSAIVETRGLTKIYGEGDAAVTALDRLDLRIEHGEFVAIMGPSGCGKSTLLNMIGGLDGPTEGEVFIDGREVGGMTDNEVTELRRRRIDFVFQFFNLIPVLDATENAALPLALDGTSQAEANRRATSQLESVGLGDRLHNRPDQLSGGQQQRVAIARALVTDPALVLADEPTGNLDSKSAGEVAQLLRHASDQWGKTIVMVTHDPRIAGHARRMVLMRDGRIEDDIELGEHDGEAARKAMVKAGLL
ncbi:MAG: ABC transporter ATP-binding protein [Coriobacteriales bacterium]|nr:ABC transporter ATP-binding protein [Coriobacteriales bacterium]